jgi:hypothetical protein
VRKGRQGLGLRIALTLLLGFAGAWELYAEPPAESGDAAAAALVADLGHDEFERREAATTALVALGAKAVPHVQAAVESPDLEVAIRALGVLERLYVHGDETTWEPVEEALDALEASSVSSTVERVRALRSMHAEARELRSLEKLVSLGAEWTLSALRNRFAGQIAIVAGPQVTRSAKDVLIGEDWKGGVEGLKHLKRLKTCQVVYVTPGAGLSDEVLQDLAKTVEGARIETRGAGMLGIQGEEIDSLVQISGLKSGGPAERAGVKPGDLLMLYQGEQVTTFQTVIQMTRSMSATEEVEVVVLRREELLTYRFKLEKFALEKLNINNNPRPAPTQLR